MAAFRPPLRDYGAAASDPLCPSCLRIHYPFCSPFPNPNFASRLYDPPPSDAALPPPAHFPGHHSFPGALQAEPFSDPSFRPRYTVPYQAPDRFDYSSAGDSLGRLQSNRSAMLLGEPRISAGEWLAHEGSSRESAASLGSGMNATSQLFLDQEPKFHGGSDRNLESGFSGGHSYSFFDNTGRDGLSGVRVGAEVSSSFAHDRVRDFPQDVRSDFAHDRIRDFPQDVRSNERLPDFLQDARSNERARDFPQDVHSNEGARDFLQDVRSNDRARDLLQDARSNDRARDFPQDVHSSDRPRDFPHGVRSNYMGFRGAGGPGYSDSEIPLIHSRMYEGEVGHDGKRFGEENLLRGSNLRKGPGYVGLQTVQEGGKSWIDRRDSNLKFYSEIRESGSLEGSALDKYDKGGPLKSQQSWEQTLTRPWHSDAHAEELIGYSQLPGAGLRHDPLSWNYPNRGDNRITERQIEGSSLSPTVFHHTRIPLPGTKNSSSLDQQNAGQAFTGDSRLWGKHYDGNDQGMQAQKKNEPKKAPISREEELLIEHGLLEHSPEDAVDHPSKEEQNVSPGPDGERAAREGIYPGQGADVKGGLKFFRDVSVSSTSNVDRFQRDSASLRQSQHLNEMIYSGQTAEKRLPSGTDEYGTLHAEKLLPPESMINMPPADFPSGASFSFRQRYDGSISSATGIEAHSFQLEKSRHFHFPMLDFPNSQSALRHKSNRVQEILERDDAPWKKKLRPDPSTKFEEAYFEQQSRHGQDWERQIQAPNEPYIQHKKHITDWAPTEQQSRLQEPSGFQMHVQQESMPELSHAPNHQSMRLSASSKFETDFLPSFPYSSQQSEYQGSRLPGQSASQERFNPSSREQLQHKEEDNYLRMPPRDNVKYASNPTTSQRRDTQSQSFMQEHQQISPSEWMLPNQQEQSRDLQRKQHFLFQEKLPSESVQRISIGQHFHAQMQQQEPQPHSEINGRVVPESFNHHCEDVAHQSSHPSKILEQHKSPEVSRFLQHQHQTILPSSMQRLSTISEGHYQAVTQISSLQETSLSGLSDVSTISNASRVQQPSLPSTTQSPFNTSLQSGHMYPPLLPKFTTAVLPPPPPSSPPAPPSPPPLPSSPQNTGHPGNVASAMASSLLSASHRSHGIQGTTTGLQYQHTLENIAEVHLPSVPGSSLQSMTHGQGSQVVHHLPFNNFGNHLQNISPKVVQQQETSKIVDAANIFRKPGRLLRPERFVIILRGLPGSGKSHLAKALRDVEVMNGGNAPRIHSMDDYFMAEIEQDQADNDGFKLASKYRGKKRTTHKVMKYCYEPEMEESYRASMFRAFKKTLEEGLFSFIIVDDRNILVADFAQFWAIAKRSGYEVYVLEATYKDPGGCAARNIHEFTLEQVQKMSERWEPTPQMYLQLDVSSLFREDNLNAQEITEVEMDMDDLERDLDEQEDAFVRPELKIESPLRNDKWSENNLKHTKLLKKHKRTMSPLESTSNSSSSNEDAPNALSGLMKAYGKKEKSVHWGDMQDGEESERGFSIGAVPGKKRHLVIGPGAGYNQDSNPTLDEDIDKGSESQIHESKENTKNWKLFEQLRDEQEAFKAVFARRHHRIIGFDEDELAL